MKLFVYGTLKKGYANHHVLDGAEFVGVATMTSAKMYSLGGFPGLKKVEVDGNDVVGEVYEINDAVLKRCDRLEGHPDFYNRRTALVLMDNSDVTEVSYYEYPHPVSEKYRIASF